jgi:hypothetical protein
MSLEFIDFGNGVLLFKNVLKDPKKTYQFMLDLESKSDPYFKWEKWLQWGRQAISLPVTEKTYKTSDSYGAELQRESLNVFFEMIDIYKKNSLNHDFFDERFFEKNLPNSYEQIEYNNSQFRIEDLVLFEANKNNHNSWHMVPHQDVNYWWGGSRNIFNCNIYVNDDYEGGELVFYKYNGKTITYTDSYSKKTGEAWVMEDVFTYKPKAGDALLLQTNAWHGVMPMKGNTPKYYIRQVLAGSDHPVKEKYINSFNFSEEYKNFFQEEKTKADKNRITPVQFDSIDSIDLDDPKYSNAYDKRVPFIIGNYKEA